MYYNIPTFFVWGYYPKTFYRISLFVLLIGFVIISVSLPRCIVTFYISCPSHCRSAHRPQDWQTRYVVIRHSWSVLRWRSCALQEPHWAGRHGLHLSDASVPGREALGSGQQWVSLSYSSSSLPLPPPYSITMLHLSLLSLFFHVMLQFYFYFCISPYLIRILHILL